MEHIKLWILSGAMKGLKASLLHLWKGRADCDSTVYPEVGMSRITGLM